MALVKISKNVEKILEKVMGKGAKAAANTAEEAVKVAAHNGRRLGKVFVGAKKITLKEAKQRIQAGDFLKRAKKTNVSKRSSNANLKHHSDGSIRDAKGRFAGKTGTVPGTPGVEKAITKIKTDPAYKGYDVLGNEISVKSANGTLRRYDVVCRKPDGTIVGVEVKSGTATRTKQQRKIDDELMKNGGLSTTGEKARNIRVKKIDTVEVIHVD